jgi:hypothetical protein
MNVTTKVVLLKKYYLYLILVVVHLIYLNRGFQTQVEENWGVLENVDPKWEEVVVTRRNVETREMRERGERGEVIRK